MQFEIQRDAYKPWTGEDGGEGEAIMWSLSNFFTKVNGVNIPTKKRLQKLHKIICYINKKN